MVLRGLMEERVNPTIRRQRLAADPRKSVEHWVKRAALRTSCGSCRACHLNNDGDHQVLFRARVRSVS
jgi:hypothetical protein